MKSRFMQLCEEIYQILALSSMTLKSDADGAVMATFRVHEVEIRLMSQSEGSQVVVSRVDFGPLVESRFADAWSEMLEANAQLFTQGGPVLTRDPRNANLIMQQRWVGSRLSYDLASGLSKQSLSASRWGAEEDQSFDHLLEAYAGVAAPAALEEREVRERNKRFAALHAELARDTGVASVDGEFDLASELGLFSVLVDGEQVQVALVPRGPSFIHLTASVGWAQEWRQGAARDLAATATWMVHLPFHAAAYRFGGMDLLGAALPMDEGLVIEEVWRALAWVAGGSRSLRQGMMDRTLPGSSPQSTQESIATSRALI